MSASVSAFDKKKFAKASGWGNNCALNCFSHFFVEKFFKEDPELIARFADPSNEFYEKYQGLLRTFEEYYQLEKNSVNFSNLMELLTQYENPLDHEAILSPVLRLHLPKTFQTADKSWSMLGVEAAVRSYFKDGQISPISKGFMEANEEVFKLLRTTCQYGGNWQAHREAAMLCDLPGDSAVAYERYTDKSFQEKLTVKKLQGMSPEEFNKVRVAFGELKNQYMTMGKNFWIESGCELYNKHIGDILRAVLITDSEVGMFAQHFGLGLQIYEQTAAGPLMMYDSKNEEPDQNIVENFYFILSHATNHWSYLTDTEEEARMHNKFYTNKDYGVYGITMPHRRPIDIVEGVKVGVLAILGNREEVDKKVQVEQGKRASPPVKKAPPVSPVKILEPQRVISVESELREKLARAEAEIKRQRERAEAAEVELAALKQEIARSKSPQSFQASVKKAPPPPPPPPT